MSDDLLNVGPFANRAGLSVHALRHYDALGLLKPTEVDPDTGYRRYSTSLLTTARLIADLRWLDVPLPDVRDIVAAPSSDRARALLESHADRLVRTRKHLDQQIAQCSAYASEGVPMPTVATTVVPVQLKIRVADKDRARRFYEDAFGLAAQVIRHTEDADYDGYLFGDYGQPGFFLLLLVDDTDFDCPGRSTLGLLVPDLDTIHHQALAAGATETVPITDAEGMPRASAVTDLDGNWVWLYQG